MNLGREKNGREAKVSPRFQERASQSSSTHKGGTNQTAAVALNSPPDDRWRTGVAVPHTAPPSGQREKNTQEKAQGRWPALTVRDPPPPQ